MKYLVVFCLTMIATSVCAAQEIQKRNFPCRMADYRIVKNNELRIRCGRQATEARTFSVEIVELNDQGAALAGTGGEAKFTMTTSGEQQWATVVLEQPLSPEKKYRLSTLPRYPNGQVETEFEIETFDFNTKSSASVAIPYGGGNTSIFVREDGRRRFLLSSKVAFDPESLNAVDAGLSEDLPPFHRPLDVKFESLSSPRRIGAPNEPSDEIGQVFAWIAPPGPRSLNTHLSVLGVKNIFGQTLVIPAAQRLQLPGAPKNKAGSEFYLKLLNQAGKGSKPGWAVDIKFDPSVKNLGHGFMFSPQVLIDMGFGTVEGAKVTNMIKLGLGVSKYVDTRNVAMPGIQWTSRFGFETDRKGNHRNLLFDGDAQFFGKGWLQSIKDQNSRIYANAAFTAVQNGQPLPNAATLPQATWGRQFQSFLGTEIGGQASADSFRSSDNKTSIIVPTYNVARLRQKMAFTYEYKRFAASLSATSRYLFVSENVTRERQVPDSRNAANQIYEIYLDRVRGFRAYGEAGLSWQFDLEGHYALTIVYKLGSLPPNFDRVNTVQTGITIMF